MRKSMFRLPYQTGFDEENGGSDPPPQNLCAHLTDFFRFSHNTTEPSWVWEYFDRVAHNNAKCETGVCAKEFEIKSTAGYQLSHIQGLLKGQDGKQQKPLNFTPEVCTHLECLSRHSGQIAFYAGKRKFCNLGLIGWIISSLLVGSKKAQ